MHGQTSSQLLHTSAPSYVADDIWTGRVKSEGVGCDGGVDSPPRLPFSTGAAKSGCYASLRQYQLSRLKILSNSLFHH